jgi:hypothetical protein
LAHPGRYQRHGRAQLALDFSRGGQPERAARQCSAFGHRLHDLVGRAAAQVALVEPAHATEILDGHRRPLRDPDERKVRQDEPHRLVDLGGSALTPRRDGLGDTHGATAQLARLLDAPPRFVRTAVHGGPPAQLLALVERPVEAAVPFQVGTQVVVERQEVLDVGCRVRALVLRERAAQPVREAVALRQPNAELAFDERRQRRRAVSREAGRQLRVEQLCRHRAARPVEHFDVLRGRVHDDDSRACEYGRERLEFDRERVDERDARAPSHLYQGDVREVRALAVELGVDRDRGFAAEALDERVDSLGRVDPARLHPAVSPARRR